MDETGCFILKYDIIDGKKTQKTNIFCMIPFKTINSLIVMYDRSSEKGQSYIAHDPLQGYEAISCLVFEFLCRGCK